MDGQIQSNVRVRELESQLQTQSERMRTLEEKVDRMGALEEKVEALLKLSQQVIIFYLYIYYGNSTTI